MTGKVQLGVAFLCHTELELAARMVRIWHDGGAIIAIHIDAKAPEIEVEKMQQQLADLPNIFYTPRRSCKWGSFSLIEATLVTAAKLLEERPDCTHVYLASGACLPLRPIADLVAFLAQNPTRDYIESVDVNEVGWVVGGLNQERFTLYFPFDWRNQRWLFDHFVSLQRLLRIKRRLPKGLYPHLGSQWWCLTASTIRAILDDPRKAEFDRFFRKSWIPDEGYFQSLVRRHSRDIESMSLTLGKFDHRGRPYQAYDDQLAVLEDSDSFVVRKVWSGATRLLARFPRPAQRAPDPRPPRPEHIERLVEATVQRHVLGRPGLYMQSRFPRRNAENGVTAAPYALIQGLSDIFIGFEDWLRDHLTCEVHGHLFGPDAVEFAHRKKVGPGAIPASVAVRDHDPQGFLTSLIRISPRKQVFQFSPRDNQDLNWFIASDPNAYLFVLTGTWHLPIMDAGMPFDDVRRITALLQRSEARHLGILNSVWVKARVDLWEPFDFITQPKAILGRMLHEIDPNSRPVTELPQMRSLVGLPEYLRQLRNSGLNPRLASGRRSNKIPQIITTLQNDAGLKKFAGK